MIAVANSVDNHGHSKEHKSAVKLKFVFKSIVHVKACAIVKRHLLLTINVVVFKSLKIRTRADVALLRRMTSGMAC